MVILDVPYSRLHVEFDRWFVADVVASELEETWLVDDICER